MSNAVRRGGAGVVPPGARRRGGARGAIATKNMMRPPKNMIRNEKSMILIKLPMTYLVTVAVTLSLRLRSSFAARQLLLPCGCGHAGQWPCARVGREAAAVCSCDVPSVVILNLLK